MLNRPITQSSYAPHPRLKTSYALNKPSMECHLPLHDGDYVQFSNLAGRAPHTTADYTTADYTTADCTEDGDREGNRL